MLLLTKSTVNALRSRVQSALKRCDEITTEICPAPTRMPVAADVTAMVDLMVADAVEMLSSAGHVLQQVEPKLTNDTTTHTLNASEIALIARADQKIMHCFDLLNKAAEMIDGRRSIWDREIHRGAL